MGLVCQWCFSYALAVLFSRGKSLAEPGHRGILNTCNKVVILFSFLVRIYPLYSRICFFIVPFMENLYMTLFNRKRIVSFLLCLLLFVGLLDQPAKAAPPWPDGPSIQAEVWLAF